MKKIGEKITLHVEGMTCNNCVNSVSNIILEVTNVEHVDVSLGTGKAIIKGNNVNIDEVVEAITCSGYSVEVVKKSRDK